MIETTQLRSALQWPADREDELVFIRDAVVALWEETTGLLWDARTGHVETIRTFGARPYSIRLELLPATSVTTVEERTDGEPTWWELDSDVYELQGRRTLVKTDGVHFADWVKVTYDGGAAVVDADIRQALIVQAKFHASRLEGADLTVASKGRVGEWKKMLDPDLHPLFAATARRKGRKA